MRVAADLGGRDQTDLYMGAYYAEAGAWRIEALFGLGRYDEARAVGKDAVAVAEKVLERRPGYRLALHAQQIMESEFGGLASADLNPLEAARASQRAESVSATILRLDPDNTTSINNLAVAELESGNDLWAAGRLREGILSLRRSAEDFGRASAGGTMMSISYVSMTTRTAVYQAFLGDDGGAAATVAAGGAGSRTVRAVADRSTEECGLVARGGEARRRPGAHDSAVARHPAVAWVDPREGGAQHGLTASVRDQM